MDNIYDVFIHDILSRLPNKPTINEIETIVKKNFPQDINTQFIFFKNIRHRTMEIHSGIDSIDDTFKNIVLSGTVSDILLLVGRDEFYQFNI